MSSTQEPDSQVLETNRSHWVEDYQFKRWDAQEFNCWHFVRSVYIGELGINLRLYDTDPKNTVSVAREIRDGEDSMQWGLLNEPEELCLVVLGKGSSPTHVGVWTQADGGLIVHCNEGEGVSAMTLQKAARIGYNVIRFYRYADSN